MKPDEAAFESHIAEWLVDHGGYTAWKLGTQSTDFDPARGLDTVELSTATADSSTSTIQASESSTGQDASGVSGFVAEVWADDWFALYVNGELVGEDSVPMTTERSFNAETIAFEAEYPLTIAIEAKDFKETDSGIEYIGEPKQQMGDGGLIAQITDTETGEVIAVSTSDWSTLV
ncbi:MAG: hypothetical protein U9O63_04570, partial [Actinomycetota bacterium]|nr:hypothetical protein [Actinomycetota bacterium]